MGLPRRSTCKKICRNTLNEHFTQMTSVTYPIVRIGKYKSHQSKSKIGQRARFKVKPPRVGWIVQNVTLRWKLDGETETISYSEAWRIISNRKIVQQGDDDFMLPISWLKNHSGSLRIVAHAWWQPTLSADFAKGEGDVLWGTLYGADELQTPPDNARVLERLWNVTWQRNRIPTFESRELLA